MVVDHKNEEEEEVKFEVKKTNKMAIVPTSLATFESLTIPVVQEIVLLADFRCKGCQDRVNDIVSRLNGETESIEISLMEKKVTLTLTRRHPRMAKMLDKEFQPVTIYKNNASKFSLVRKMFCSSSG